MITKLLQEIVVFVVFTFANSKNRIALYVARSTPISMSDESDGKHDHISDRTC